MWMQCQDLYKQGNLTFLPYIDIGWHQQGVDSCQFPSGCHQAMVHFQGYNY